MKTTYQIHCETCGRLVDNSKLEGDCPPKKTVWGKITGAFSVGSSRKDKFRTEMAMVKAKRETQKKAMTGTRTHTLYNANTGYHARKIF
jgi:hypothetical protein